MILTYAAWLATAVILITYARVQQGHGTRAFDWANAIGCIPLAAVSILAGAYQPAAVSIVFGGIAWYGHAAAWRERRALKRWAAAKHTDTGIKQWVSAEAAQHRSDLDTVSGLSDLCRGRVAVFRSAYREPDPYARMWESAVELHARGLAEREASLGEG